MSAVIDAASERGIARFETRMVILSLAVLATIYVVGSTTAEVALTVIAVCLFVALFVLYPPLAPVCIVTSVGLGGVVLDISGKAPRLFFATLVSIAYVISVAIREALSRVRHDVRDDRNPAARLLVWMLAAYALLVPLSATQMQEAPRSLYLILTRLVVVVSVLLLLRERRVSWSKQGVLLGAAVTGTFIAASYMWDAVQQYGTTDVRQLAIRLALKDNTVWAGVLGTTNAIASFLVVTLPLTLGLLLLPRASKRVHVAAAVALVLQAAGLLSTASRGGVLSLVLGAVIAAFLSTRSRAHVQRTFGFLVGAILVVALGYGLLQDALKQNFVSRFAGDALEWGAQGRFVLWRASWDAFVSSPLLGVGIGNMPFFDRDFGSGFGQDSHNLILQLLAEEGIVAAMLMVAVLWRLTGGVVRAAKDGTSSDVWVLVAIAGGLINGMLEPTFLVQPAFLTLFLVIAAFFYRHAIVSAPGATGAVPQVP